MGTFDLSLKNGDITIGRQQKVIYLYHTGHAHANELHPESPIPSVLEMVRDAIQTENARKAAFRREMEVVIAETMKLFNMTRGEVFEVLGKITRDEA